MKIKVYKSKVSFPLITKNKKEKEISFHIAERKENGKTTAFSFMSNFKGK